VNRRGPALAAACLVLGTVACSSPDAPPTPSGGPSRAAFAEPTPAPPAAGCDPLASYAPAGPPPRPGAMPAGSTMARIVARGRLIVGTSGDKPLMAARDPRTGDLSGIDVDLSLEVARALFGPGARVEFRTMPYAARERALERGEVDMVAHSMTMTCDRWQRVGFSTAYFRDGQRLLVRSDSPAREVEHLVGRRVCVARGTTTIANLRRYPWVVVVPVDDAADCLVLLQRGEVDAITSNDIVLLGYAIQDPYVRVVGRALSDESRGLAFRRDAVDLIRFVNAVPQRLRADGGLARILSARLAPLGRQAAVPSAVYGRTP
jgi:polar amino acid transport system substrate-binding protein